MAITAKMYGKGMKNMVDGNIDWDAHTIKVALLTSAYTPDQDAHDAYDDVSANEVASGGGYTTGGETLASKTSTYTGGTNKEVLDADDVVWAASTITARYAVVYKDSGVAGTSWLLGYVDFGNDFSSSSGAFTLTWNAGGIFEFTVA